MSNFPTVPKKFFLIDETNRDEYYYLTRGDQCLYLWERMSKVKTEFNRYPANNFISNFQIPVSCKTKNPHRYKHKQQAINFAAAALASVLPGAWSAESTFVPVPPSRIKGDADYDDRLLRTLETIRPELSDVRELVLQRESVDAKQKGKAPADRADNYYVDDELADPEPSSIFIFDDVLTTGCHYKAIEMVLRRRFARASIAGIFLARAVRPPEDSDQ